MKRALLTASCVESGNPTIKPFLRVENYLFFLRWHSLHPSCARKHFDSSNPSHIGSSKRKSRETYIRGAEVALPLHWTWRLDHWREKGM